MGQGLIGSIVAGHRIERVAGRGGMGVVYEATHEALDRKVALKVIAPDLADDEGFRARFIAESKTAASIDHPNIVPIYHAGEDNGVLFLAMRFVPGDDLGTIVRRDGPLGAMRAARVVGQLASALDAAHGRGLVHRDVKPANVLLTNEDHPYLTDFGITKRLDATTAATRSGEVLGTLDYIAPEQIRGERLGPWTDVYALGCVLFHLLTGRVPFPLEGNESKMWAHLSERPPRPSDLQPGVPAGFDAVIARGMAKAPADRFTSAGELARAAVAAASDNETRARTAPRLAGPLASPAEHARAESAKHPGHSRALATRAVLEPFNIALPLVVLGAGIAFGAVAPALLLAVLLYAAAATRSFFDSDLRQRVASEHGNAAGQVSGPRESTEPASPIDALVSRAQASDRRIRVAIERAELPYAEVSEEVDRFLKAIEQTARRAQLLYEGLEDAPPREIERRVAELKAAADPEKAGLVEALSHQLAAQIRMQGQLDRFYDDMERMLVELDTIRGHVVSVSASSETDHQQRVAGEVRGLRERLGAVGDSLRSAHTPH